MTSEHFRSASALRTTIRRRIFLAVLILGGTVGLMAWLYVRAERSLQAARNGQSKALTANLESLAPPVSLINNRGAELAQKADYERAIAYFRHAAERQPGYLPARKNLLAACVETGRWEEALEAAEACRRIMTFRARETEKSLWDWIESGEPPEDPQQREALRGDPDFLANLGRAYRRGGRTGLAGGVPVAVDDMLAPAAPGLFLPPAPSVPQPAIRLQRPGKRLLRRALGQAECLVHAHRAPLPSGGRVDRGGWAAYSG